MPLSSLLNTNSTTNQRRVCFICVLFISNITTTAKITLRSESIDLFYWNFFILFLNNMIRVAMTTFMSSHVLLLLTHFWITYFSYYSMHIERYENKKKMLAILMNIRKHAYSHHFFPNSTNIFIQVIFPNVITYLDRNFKEEQNDIIFKMKSLMHKLLT